MYIAERFRFAALSDRPDYGSEETFALEELSDAFVMNYNRSTIGFRSGMLVTDRIPPLEQYLNLLKCVWLFERIQSSPSLLNSDTNSHWPSYVRQLEEVSAAIAYDLHVSPSLTYSGLVNRVRPLRPRARPARVGDSATETRYVQHLA